ncbi:hypothetical protein J2Z31_002947 [Sinorhizobium kostiense]|uniref:Uncharacterized protein n=1 Tax=Sinorhizobium kostiense TaxID=76747 RepID=A0ABS4R0L1_9HYPH|nr:MULTISPECIES: hypothetical protein [Sinorhizobium]MBP2236433.1 hypothetical protein [Sinorhizobium kostiense]
MEDRAGSCRPPFDIGGGHFIGRHFFHNSARIAVGLQPGFGGGLVFGQEEQLAGFAGAAEDADRAPTGGRSSTLKVRSESSAKVRWMFTMMVVLLPMSPWQRVKYPGDV